VPSDGAPSRAAEVAPAPVRPASSGGPGFKARTGTHAGDVAQGRGWLRCGLRSEVERLRSVILAWPGEELLVQGSPDDHLMLERVNLEEIRRQARGLASLFESQGVRVHLATPSRLPPPNFIFMRDLFFMTPEGAVLSRMASSQRAGEERHAAEALALIGVPVIALPRGEATVEGADVLWLAHDRVLVGVGGRTNRAGFELVSGLLGTMGVDTVAIPMPAGVQHLLGVVDLLSAELAAVRREKAPRELSQALSACHVTELPVPESEEVTAGRAMNFVCLEPMKIVMPSSCPRTARWFGEHGVTVLEADAGEYVRAAGGLACATGILHRGE